MSFGNEEMMYSFKSWSDSSLSVYDLTISQVITSMSLREFLIDATTSYSICLASNRVWSGFRFRKVASEAGMHLPGM